MTEKEYRLYPAISRSQLWKISESPEKFKYELDNPSEPTDALILGQAFHKLVLEPETFSDEFAVAPAVDRRTKTGKAEYAEFIENCRDKTVIATEMCEKIIAMSEKLKSNSYVQNLLSGEREKPYFWTDDFTGEDCKCRVDVKNEISNIPLIIDIKTAVNADTDIFMRHALKYGYHVQTAMYLEGVKANTGVEHGFVFIVIEKDPPYAINIVQADEAFISYGHGVFRDLIGIYHDCRVTNNWYGYMGKENAINMLELPAYLINEI